MGLFNRNFGTNRGLASETADFALLVGDNAIFGGVDGVVAAQRSAFASTLGQANLADDNLADGDFFATKQLNTESLTGTVMVVFTGSTCFNV